MGTLHKKDGRFYYKALKINTISNKRKGDAA